MFPQPKVKSCGRASGARACNLPAGVGRVFVGCWQKIVRHYCFYLFFVWTVYFNFRNEFGGVQVLVSGRQDIDVIWGDFVILYNFLPNLRTLALEEVHFFPWLLWDIKLYVFHWPSVMYLVQTLPLTPKFVCFVPTLDRHFMWWTFVFVYTLMLCYVLT